MTARLFRFARPIDALALAFCLAATMSPARGQQPADPGLAGPPPLIQYPNTPLRLILADYEVQSGLKLIKDASILDLEVSIETVQPMATREEWLDYIERALLLNGIAFVPLDNEMAKVITYLTGAKQLSDLGINTYSEEPDLPEGEVVVNYIMPLKYVSTEEATRIFQEYTKNSSTQYAGITQVPDANVLIITENALIVKDLIKLQDKIDVRPGQVEQKMFQLLRADAETVASAINDILTQQQEARSGGTGVSTARRTAQPTPTRTTQPPGTGAPAAATSAPSPTASGSVAQPIVVYPDVRTNRVMVIARPVDVTYIESIIKALDAEVEVKNFINRPLNHIGVELVLPVLENALALQADPAAATGQGSALTSGAGGGAGRTTGLGGGGNLNNRFGGAQTNFNTGFNNRSTFGAGQTGFGGGGGGGAGAPTGGIFGDIDTGPMAIPVGRTLLIGDPTLNNIIAAGPPEDLRLVSTILDEIDVKPRQVYLSTIIGQVTLGDRINAGIDLLHEVKEFELFGENVRTGGLFQTGSGGLLDVDTLDSVGAFPQVTGLSVYGQIGDYVTAYLRALESTNRFEVLSRPSIYIRNNRIGVIQSGQAVAVPTTTQSNFTGGITGTGLTSNIDYRDILLQLQIQPLINSDDEVTLKILQVNDDIIGSQVISGTTVPTIGRQQLETEVTVPNKSTIVLGGLITESKRNDKTGLPVLVHVPILKYLFSQTEIETDRQELLFFIQPHIITTAEDLRAANLEHTETSEMTQGVLEFGRRRSGEAATNAGPPDAAEERPRETGEDFQEKETRQRRGKWGILNPRNWRSTRR